MSVGDTKYSYIYIYVITMLRVIIFTNDNKFVDEEGAVRLGHEEADGWVGQAPT